MEKIINIKKASEVCKKLKMGGKTVVLVGGCFDILHFGHIKFLKEAKKEDHVLIVALESDENIKRLKGRGRPIHSQKKRAEMLATLEVVDFVISLPLMKGNKDYLKLVKKVKPDIVAVTAGDPNFKNKQKQARIVGAKIKIVSNRLKTPSTREIVKLLKKN